MIAADSRVISDPNSKLILSASLAPFKKSQTENWAFLKKSITVEWTDDEDAGNKSQFFKKWENKMKTNIATIRKRSVHDDKVAPYWKIKNRSPSRNPTKIGFRLLY